MIVLWAKVGHCHQSTLFCLGKLKKEGQRCPFEIGLLTGGRLELPTSPTHTYVVRGALCLPELAGHFEYYLQLKILSNIVWRGLSSPKSSPNTNCHQNTLLFENKKPHVLANGWFCFCYFVFF